MVGENDFRGSQTGGYNQKKEFHVSTPKIAKNIKRNLIHWDEKGQAWVTESLKYAPTKMDGWDKYTNQAPEATREDAKSKLNTFVNVSLGQTWEEFNEERCDLYDEIFNSKDSDPYFKILRLGNNISLYSDLRTFGFKLTYSYDNLRPYAHAFSFCLLFWELEINF